MHPENSFGIPEFEYIKNIFFVCGRLLSPELSGNVCNQCLRLLEQGDMLRRTIQLFPTPEMRVMEGCCSEVLLQKPFRTLSSTNFARMNICFCNVFSCSPTVSQHFLTARLKISSEDLNMGERYAPRSSFARMH